MKTKMGYMIKWYNCIVIQSSELCFQKKIVNKNGRIDIINKLLSEFRAPTVIYKHAGNASEKR